VPHAVRERVRLGAFRWLDLAWRRPSGVVVRVRDESEWDIYNEVFVDGEYDAAIDTALAVGLHIDADQPLRVLDLGANVGMFTFRVIDRVRGVRGGAPRSCEVIAVEANPDLVQELRRRLAENALDTLVVQGLAGDRTGTGVLHTDRARPGDSSIADRPHRPARAAGIAVPFIDLISLTADMPTIDLLKCDIEGAELRLLESYPDLLRKTRVLAIELHDELCDTDACHRLIAKAGFTREISHRQRESYALHTFARE
jgi:FkbM family methyltransferase